MRCVVQRSGPARVMIDGETVGAIDHGLVVLAAFALGDGAAELIWMARKLPALRIFNDAEGKMNRSLRDLGNPGDAEGGGILLVSQFTLYGDCRKGNRPSFVNAAAPEAAAQLYLYEFTFSGTTTLFSWLIITRDLMEGMVSMISSRAFALEKFLPP